jgi:hypothetical protein
MKFERFREKSIYESLWTVFLTLMAKKKAKKGEQKPSEQKPSEQKQA